MKKFFHEFKEFATRGNAMQLAIGVIIGAAFQAVVTALTDNILSPLIGLFVTQNFDTLAVDFLGVTLTYGKFLTALINFIIMAFLIFLLVRFLNRLSHHEEAPPAPARRCPYCLTPVDPAATRCPACTAEIGDKSAP